MWSVFTYIYNSILILFIATHLLVGAIISFLAGLYMGIYLSQNYEIPRITEPSRLWEKVVLFMDNYKKRPSGSSKLRFLRPSSLLSIIRDEDYNHHDQQNLCDQNPTIQVEDTQLLNGNYSPENEMEKGAEGTPELILTDLDLKNIHQRFPKRSGIRRSSSEILEAALIISSGDRPKSSSNSSSLKRGSKMFD